MLKKGLESRVPTEDLEPLLDGLSIDRNFHTGRMCSKALCRDIQSQPMARSENIMRE